MAEYYSLAMELTPPSNSELMTALLSNRCLAFINLEMFNEAVADAEKCIKIKPQWFRVSRHFSLSANNLIDRVYTMRGDYRRKYPWDRFTRPSYKLKFILSIVSSQKPILELGSKLRRAS